MEKLDPKAKPAVKNMRATATRQEWIMLLVTRKAHLADCIETAKHNKAMTPAEKAVTIADFQMEIARLENWIQLDRLDIVG